VQKQEPGESLAVFVADRTLPGMTQELLAEVQRLLHQATGRVSSTGRTVRYLQCLYFPDDDRCICVFEADDLETVRGVNEIAQVPFRRISPAIEYRWDR
jgi:uncharacterized protein DUF4242